MKQPNIIISILALAICFTACSKDSGSNEDGPMHEGTEILKDPIAKKANGSFRIMSYNVGTIRKFTNTDFTKKDNIRLLADIIREAEADAVCFQELDSCTRRNDYFQIKELVEAIDSKWQYHFAPAIEYQDGKYGSGIAAKRSGAHTYSIPIPTIPGSEDRVVAVMEYDDYVIASTHLNGSQPDQVRIINDEIRTRYADSDKPVFLGGDMNAQPHHEMMLEFKKEWVILSSTGRTTVQDRTACIDYILQFKNKAKIAKVTRSQVITAALAGDVCIASDHYAIYADVKLP